MDALLPKGCSTKQCPFTDAVDESIDGMRIAYSPDLGMVPMSETVRKVVESATDAFAAAGTIVESVSIDFGYSLPNLREQTRKATIQIFTAKLAETIRDRDGVDFLDADRDTVPEEFVERIEAGREYSAVDTGEFDAARTAVFDEIQDVFEEYDRLVTPTTSVPPIANDSLNSVTVDGESVEPRSDWILTWPFNLIGHPAASIPAGLTDDGLPVGMQIVGPRFDEEAVFAASATFESARPWLGSLPGKKA